MSARALVMGAAGSAAGSGDKLYVEDVFSTYLYTGNGSSQDINNGIALADGPANGTMVHLTGDTLTDSSPVSKTVNAVSAVVNPTTKKYGTGAIEFSGSESYLDIPNAIPGGLGGDFTIECWFYFTSNTNWTPIVETRPDDGTTTGVYFYLNSGGSFGVYPFGAFGTVPVGTWTHLAATRSGSTLRTFINGSLIGTFTADPASYPYGGTNVKVNRWIGGSGRYFNGLIDDLRITKGRALYTANFTPPAAALPLDTLVVGKGGLVWAKARSIGNHGRLFDTSRGVGKALYTSLTSAQGTSSTDLTAFGSSGFTLGSDDNINGAGNTNVAWTFAQAPKFFQIVTWVGNGVAGRQIPHGLGSVPGVIMVKRTDVAGYPWAVYHRSLGANSDLLLNQTAAVNTPSVYWNNTEPTATTFTLGSTYGVNAETPGSTYVAYLFAHDPSADGVIQCGSFTHNSTSGVSVNLGWEPQWILQKNASAASGWLLIDNMRGWTVGSNDQYLTANSSGAEDNIANSSPTATGFDVDAGAWANGANIVYMAIRRGPMRAPTDATKVFMPVARAGTGSATTITAGFPVDLIINSSRVGGSGTWSNFVDRLRGNLARLTSVSTNAEQSMSGWDAITGFDSNTGVKVGADPNGLINSVNSWGNWMFRRAPKFFQQVCYTGTGAAQSPKHNLGVVPEMMIIKDRASSTNWAVYHKDIGPTGALYLNTSGATATSSALFGNIAPTATDFTVSFSGTTNGSSMVAYLFATCPGVSKVGGYIGTGAAQTIDCGFSSGARFVMIRRWDSTGDWYVYDTARGITSSDDPYLRLNSTAAEVTTTSYVSPASVGFALNAPSTLINGSGDAYIYFAIA